MKRIGREEYIDFLLKATNYVSASEICEEAKLDKATFSKFLSGERNPGVENQERIIRAAIKCIDNKIPTFDDDEREGAKEVISRGNTFLLDVEVNDQNTLDKFYQNSYNVFMNLLKSNTVTLDSFNEVWEKLEEYSDSELLWLDKYYDEINKFFSFEDLFLIKTGNYEDGYFKVENNITLTDVVLNDDNLEKTLACIYIAGNAYDLFELRDNIINIENNNEIKERFYSRLVKYNSIHIMENLSGVMPVVTSLSDCKPFLRFIKYMLEITSKEWFRYAKYRLYLVLQKEKDSYGKSDAGM